MSKLNNVKAVNEMMRGEHRTQTRKSKGYEKKVTHRQTGDAWEDEHGQKWIQKSGYKSKVSRFKDIRKAVSLTVCPACDKKATSFDKPFITREGKCHDCVIKHETLMTCEGYVKNEPIYEQWEREKIRENVTSFIKDASKDVEMLKQKFTKTEFINSDGTVDKWKLPESVDSIEQSLDKQFIKFKEELLVKLEKGDKDVGIKTTTEK